MPTQRFILCLTRSKIEREKLIIRVGEYDFNLDAAEEEQPHQDRHIHDVRIHPFYRTDVVFNDMALLITDDLFNLTSHVSPICLPFLNTKFDDPKVYDPTKCIATGWGKEVHGKCNKAYEYRKTLPWYFMRRALNLKYSNTYFYRYCSRIRGKFQETLVPIKTL